MRCNELFITLTYAEFQSTHPVWGETAGICRAACRRLPFQSTHPVWDGTIYPYRKRRVQNISIHPSRVGWDNPRRILSDARRNFNPPIPCGMGRSSYLLASRRLSFQSTHPVWDGTFMQSIPSYTVCYFNPPIPCGMGPHHDVACRNFLLISIHPSRVGWDICNVE